MSSYHLRVFALILLYAILGLAYDGVCQLGIDKNGNYYIIHPKSLQCRICGWEYSGAPFRCYALNETFWGLPAGKEITQINRAVWTGLTVAAPGPKNPIKPASRLRYAVTSTSGIAFMDFPIPVGPPEVPAFDWWPLATLYSFSFACSNVSNTSQPVPCTLEVRSVCENGTESELYDPTIGSDYYHYKPVGNPLALMQAANWTVPEPNSGFFIDQVCFNYTFIATTEDGTPALLYLDNVLYNAWWNIH